MSPKAISTEMIQLCINTLTSDAVPPEEEVLGYFTRKKLYNGCLVGIHGKQMKRNKLINLTFKECSEYQRILTEYQKVQLFFDLIGNMPLNNLVCVDLECVIMVQRKWFLNYILLLVHGPHVCCFQYNSYF